MKVVKNSVLFKTVLRKSSYPTLISKVRMWYCERHSNILCKRNPKSKKYFIHWTCRFIVNLNGKKVKFFFNVFGGWGKEKGRICLELNLEVILSNFSFWFSPSIQVHLCLPGLGRMSRRENDVRGKIGVVDDFVEGV